MSLIGRAKEQMAKTVKLYQGKLLGIRTGRANPALLNGITVDYYGAPPRSGRRLHQRSRTAHSVRHPV